MSTPGFRSELNIGRFTDEDAAEQGLQVPEF
jgi:hypothetical protein